MDTADRDAQRLPIAQWSAANRLRKLAYELFLEHQPHVTWREFAKYGADPGTQVLAVTLTLEDGREMLCSLVVGMSSEAFSVESDIGVDDPDAENGYRYLLEIPESLADSLDAFIPLLDHQLDQLVEAAPRLMRELRVGATKA
ncbi:hypothetical protein ACFZAV_12580 [Streptomyces sp. NPDC008343]|uniref:hypothetical protein n=1 Tax=Streptomyces sp. NPDC008343 TaxID=3364828 RepID=UPI0036ED9878